jgi:hypothetical protein
MSDEKTSLMAELRLQVPRELSYVQREYMRATVDLLDEAIREFAKAPSWATLKTVNCLWARGWRDLEKSRASGDGDAA